MPSDKDILRAIWLKAFKSEGEVRIRYPTKPEAFSMRMRLYGLLKPLRKSPAKDPELWSAYTQCEACLEEEADGAWVLALRRKSESPVLQAALDQLNLELSDSPVPDPLELPDESSFLDRLNDS